jgi:hypothetical protein
VNRSNFSGLDLRKFLGDRCDYFQLFFKRRNRDRTGLNITDVHPFDCYSTSDSLEVTLAVETSQGGCDKFAVHFPGDRQAGGIHARRLRILRRDFLRFGGLKCAVFWDCGRARPGGAVRERIAIRLSFLIPSLSEREG